MPGKNQPRDERLAYMKRWHQETKDIVFEAYGGYICACCGETEKVFLVIDHVDGGGNTERKKISTSGGAGQYSYLVGAGFPAGYQVLCHNCNFAKTRLGKCPHQEVKEFKVDFEDIMGVKDACKE